MKCTVKKSKFFIKIPYTVDIIKFLYFNINIDNQISIMNGNVKYQLKKRILKNMSKNTNEIIGNFYASMGETHSSMVETNVAKKNKKVVLPFVAATDDMTINNNELNIVASDEINERMIQNTESTESFVDDLNVEHDENFNFNDIINNDENRNDVDEDDIDIDIDIENSYNYDYNQCYWLGLTQDNQLINENISDEQIEIQHEQEEKDNKWNLEIMFKELDKMKLNDEDFHTTINNCIYNCYYKQLPSDFKDSFNGDYPLLPDPTLKKIDFAERLGNFVKMVNMKESDIVNLLQILHDFYPFSKLPIKISKKGKIISKLEDYNCSKIPILEFDVCINSCVVFSGEHSTSWYCPNCNSLRFTYCKKCRYQGKRKYECKCIDRIPVKTVSYRPIKALIINLMNYESFRKLIDYEYFDMNLYFDRNQKHWDIKTSTVYKQNYNEMKKKFNDFNNSETDKNKYKMINIMISQFYDGCAIYRNKISSFHPLIITILNLPPNYRYKMGVGMFTLSIFSSNSKSIVEDFLFNNLYVEELMSLNDGFAYQISDEINKKDLYFFIQVRQIQGIFDTIAAQDKLKIQSSGSLAGCGLCNSGKGNN